MFRFTGFRASHTVAPLLALLAVGCGSSSNTSDTTKAGDPSTAGASATAGGSGTVGTSAGSAGATGAVIGSTGGSTIGGSVGGATGGTVGTVGGGATGGIVGSTSGGAATGTSGAGPTTSGGTTGSFGTTGSVSTSGASSTGAGATTGSTTGTVVVPPPAGGLLTAGVWDDNRNYPWFTAYRDQMYASQTLGLVPLTADVFSAAHDAYAGLQVAHSTLDVSFVIDTTGSMGDELAYLQAEFLAISTTIGQRFPNADPHWSVILYRDVNMGDAYTTRVSDFQSDAMAFQAYLAMQSAGGGGDIPEAPDKALALVPQLNWRSGASAARMLFWVADAPHHNENAGAMATAFTGIQKLGVHVYPIASSGVDELTELTMRSAAQLTGGRYMFLTNDSGIGGDHKEPTIPCYFVTKLNDAMLRMVDIEMTGVYKEPAASEIIRTGGNPVSNACTASNGQTLYPF